MDRIPSDVQQVIDELVKFQHTRREPNMLAKHLNWLPQGGNGVGAKFFREIYDILRTDADQLKHYSESEFKQNLKEEYHQLAEAERQAEAERRAWWREEFERLTKEKDDHKKKARAEFDALGKEMAKATTHAKLVELGRKRVKLAPYTGFSYVYENHCWQCHTHISSKIHARCPECRWYICSSCSSCSPACPSI